MLIDEIADLLAVEGLGTVGTDLFVGHLPAAPDTALAVFATGGLPAGSYPLDEPTIQVRSRSDALQTAYNRAMAAYSTLHGLHHVTLPGNIWLLNCLGMQSAPTGIGRDEAGREEFVINFRLVVRNATEHRP